jgi:preprotein translocase subunit SecD
MNKAKLLFKDLRIWLLIIALVFAVVAINPHPFVEGVAIRAVVKDSPAYQVNMSGPSPQAMPVSRERIIEMNSRPIENKDDYYNVLSSLRENQSIYIKTDRAEYFIPQVEYRNDTPYLGLSVYDAPTTNLRQGLDLEGGTRAILRPETNNTQDLQSFNDDIDIVIQNLRKRLNTYGLSDITVRSAVDLDGNTFIIVEVAGANDEEVRQLLSQQGKFEAKIGNETVFRGGTDIVSVCRTSQCSYAVDPNRGGCSKVASDQYMCTFSFAITLSPEAAQRFADITKELSVVTGQGGENYLNESIKLYLDDVLVDTLNIAADLKGVAQTRISISGPGYGKTRNEAVESSAANMRNLQTILMTGSLPLKLEIVKMDSLSPLLGQEFLINSLKIGLIAILVVVSILLFRYRTPQMVFPIIITMVSELLITLGFAALVGWNLDLAAIGGLIIAIGSGVDDQIVISDELLKGLKTDRFVNWKRRLASAFFIVMGAYFTTAVAMVPLMWAGVGLLKGFAFTTLVGISVGVFITRPAFAKMIEILARD